MSDNKLPGAWMAMGAAVAGLFWYSQFKKGDHSAFYKLIENENVTDPRKVWDICCERHDKLKRELSEAKARIEAGEDICRVGKGLADVRKMMKSGSKLPSDVALKQIFGQEITDEDREKAYAKMQSETVPMEVKAAIIAHWWTELIKLFVPWGIVLADEIEAVQEPCFRLVGPEVREAILRLEVYRYKEAVTTWKDLYKKTSDDNIESFKRHSEERSEWRKEKSELLAQIAELKSAKEETNESV